MGSKVIPLFQEYFSVKNIDEDGKPFDKVSRLSCAAETDDVKMTLDINMDIYPVRLNEQLRVTIASSLTGDSSVEAGEFNPRIQESPLFKDNEYIMFGRVFKTKTKPPNVSIYASFGGLLMQLFGDPSNLKDITALDSNLNIYLLISKTSSY